MVVSKAPKGARDPAHGIKAACDPAPPGAFFLLLWGSLLQAAVLAKKFLQKIKKAGVSEKKIGLSLPPEAVLRRKFFKEGGQGSEKFRSKKAGDSRPPPWVTKRIL
ncbi:MAG: hypothetical protein SPL30_01660 [Succinivibrio sp.]|jgi:hypothetical protein|nr:hypothetical protein [Succinivibrio sp.]